MIDYTTPGGKKVELITDSKSALYRFQFNPGGELPQELTGLFTQERYAVAALNRYIARMEEKNGPAKIRKAVQ